MAGVFVSLVMQGLTGADPSAKLVAVALADFAQVKDHGVAFPSVSRLCAVTGLSERQVQQHLRQLRTDGWIAPEGATHGGRGMSTRYRLNLPKLRANMRMQDDHPPHAKGCDAPQGLSTDKGCGPPQGLDPGKGAADCGDSCPQADDKGCGPASERVRSSVEKGAAGRTRTGVEPVFNRVSHAHAREAGGSAVPLREMLQPRLKEANPGTGKGDDREGSDPKATPMTRDEQLAYVARMAKGASS